MVALQTCYVFQATLHPGMYHYQLRYLSHLDLKSTELFLHFATSSVLILAILMSDNDPFLKDNKDLKR